MTPSDSGESLVARLRALPAAERAIELERAFAADSALRDQRPEIMAALAATGDRQPVESGGRLSPESMVMVLESALEVAPSEVPGTRIGPYKLLQEIGRGGFGVVWVAEQETPMRRRVALKIIKAGMDTREVIARFEAERQALAMMDHPNIARVFDAGATEAGRPYFVMELVRGVAITRYSDENRLPADERLQLFVAVCQAVQHAHQKGVIHRDLKPSNILVTLHDSVPVPKIIDFGIAKATGGTLLTDKTLFTQFHAFIGTPAYTSPEQMEMSGLDVDTRSDIYSLGVLLYELLAGRQPFDADALLKSGLEAMRRTIREVDPPSPSHRLTTLTDEERTSVARQRNTDAGKLSLLLRGDLDWIIMRCMEKDRTRRYETANGLALDIRRYLDSEAVEARPPSQTYRLRKFIRRHRVGFVATTAVAASLIAGLIASSILLVRERTAHSHAVVAEQAEASLRREADQARVKETKLSSRTALNLAEQLLEKNQTSAGVAYLVHAAKKDPGNTALAPRLASLLTSRNFLIPEGAPFECHARVLALRYSNDGRSIYTGTEDGTFRVFDAASGELSREVHLGKAVKREGWVFADRSDAVFAVCFVDRTIGLFEVKTGRPAWPQFQFDLKLPHGGHSGIEPNLQLSPDGRWLCVHGVSTFWILDAANGEILTKQSFTKFYFGPVFTNDGSRVAFISEDTVHVLSLPWCKPSFEPLTIKRAFVPGITLDPYFSPDGRSLAVVDPSGGGLHVFDATNGMLLRQDQNTPPFTGFLPDGRLFAPGPESWECRDPVTGKSTTLPSAPGFSGPYAASADGKFLLSASDDGFPRLWETNTGRLVAEATMHQHGSFCVALSIDGTQLTLGTGDGAILRLHANPHGARPLTLRRYPVPHTFAAPFFGQNPVRVLWFQPDRAVALDVVSGREVPGGFAYPKNDLPALQSAATWLHYRPDLANFVVKDWTGQLPAVVWKYTNAGIDRIGALKNDKTSPPGASALPFSTNGDLVARAIGLAEIGVWNLQTGMPVGPGCSLTNEPVIYLSLDLSPDGKYLAGPLADGRTVIWEITTGRAVIVLSSQSDSTCWFVRFNPDGTRLLTLNGRNEARLWNAATGEPASAILSGVDQGDFSPDGRWLFTPIPNAVQIRDGRNGTLISEFVSSGGGQVCFSPDSARIAAPDGEGIIRVREVHTGQPITELPRLSPPLYQVNWSPEGRFLEVTAQEKLQILSVPPSLPAATPIPPWLLQLASVCAMKKINEAEQCVDAPEFAAQIGDVRRQLDALPKDAPYVEWGRWLLDVSGSRSIAPGFSLTPTEADKVEEDAGQTTSQDVPQH